MWWMTIDCDDYNDRISCTDPRWVHAKYSMDLPAFRFGSALLRLLKVEARYSDSTREVVLILELLNQQVSCISQCRSIRHQHHVKVRSNVCPSRVPR